MKHKALLLPSFLGAGHALSDCVAGLLIGSLAGETVMEKSLLILGYNVLAFAGQVPAGMLADKISKPRHLLALSFGMSMLALLLFPWQAMFSVLAAGFASAIFHVCGGALALESTPGEAKGVGIFAAPGVLGLVAGGAMSAADSFPQIPLLILLGGFALLIFFFPFHFPDRKEYGQEKFQPDTHDLLMILLLGGIAFRSAAWNVMQAFWADDFQFLILLAVSAAAGKFSGGFMADVWGWKKFSLAALLASVVFLSLGAWEKYFSLPGVFLLQSATSPAIAAIRLLVPGRPATAAGLALGLGIAAGGIPMFLGFHPSLDILFFLPLAAVFFYFFGLGFKTSRPATP